MIKEEGAFMESSVILKHYGRLYNPSDWGYYPNYMANRFYYICSGTVTYKGKLTLKPGFVYLFRSDPDFQVVQSPDDPIDHIYFDFISSGDFVDRECIEIDPSEHPRLLAIINALTVDYTMNDMPQDVAESYLNIIFYELRDHFVSNRAYCELTTRIFRYIHESSAADLTVTGIADALGINVNHLIRTFKKDTGITPLKYIGLMKSELAISYMRKGLSLEDIAEKLGYSTVSALSVAFKNITNKNLSQFR